MTITGAEPQVGLFKGRMEIANPGSSLVQSERMVDLPPRSRNEALAALMRCMGFCEEKGSGLDKVIYEIEAFQFLPLKLIAEENSIDIILFKPLKPGILKQVAAFGEWVGKFIDSLLIMPLTLHGGR